MGNLQIGGSFKVKTGSSDGLSLRREATTKDGTNNIIFSIPNGTKVTLESDKVQTSDKRTWYNVRYTDKDKKDVIGWVANDYLEDLRPPSLPTLSWSALYDNLPSYEQYPCDKKAFPNQCAIRMGMALEPALKETGFNLDSFQGARCGVKHNPSYSHILRAQELADWLRKQTILVGKVKISSKSDPKDYYLGKRGIVFFQNITGYDGIDHIDVFERNSAKNQCSKLKDVPSTEWLGKCQQVWFWDLCPCTAKKDVNVYSETNANSTVLFTPDPGQTLEFGSGRMGWVEVKMKGGKLGFTETIIFVYSEPVVKDPTLAQSVVEPGYPLEVVAVEEKWVQIRYQGKLGWIERRHVMIPGQAVPA